jgi:hypothetical protein
MTARGKRYYRSSCIGRPGKRRVRDHLFNRLDTRDRLLRERESESNRAEQLAINVYGAPAHPLNDSSLLQRAAAQASQYDALLWAEILEYSEDFDLKIFDAIVMEDSAAHAAHSWLHVLEPEEVL